MSDFITTGELRMEAERLCNENERLQAENVKLIKREKELKHLVHDMWFWGYEGHMDNKSQDWQMKHIDGVLDRMKDLGLR